MGNAEYMGQIKNIKLHIVTDIKGITISFARWVELFVAKERVLEVSSELIKREEREQLNLDHWIMLKGMVTSKELSRISSTILEEVLHLLLYASGIHTNSNSGKSCSLPLKECTLVNSSTVERKQHCRLEIFFLWVLCLREQLSAMWKKSQVIVVSWLVHQEVMLL